MSDEAPLDSAEREYDLVSRHVLVGRLIGELVPAPGPLLDIGGSDGMTAMILPDHRVVTIDILPSGVDVIASGNALPFPNGHFRAAVVLDMLEHVPDEVKKGVVAEAVRVADIVVL